MKTTLYLFCCWLLLTCAVPGAEGGEDSPEQDAAQKMDSGSTAGAGQDMVLSNPLPGGRLMSAFGSRQSVLGSAKHHPGVDLGALDGVPVVAPADGVVMLATSAEERPGKGAMLILDHSPELKTFFNHMGSLLVEAGQRVERGEVLGYPRDAGGMAGAHIHFEVVHGGKQVDPADWIDELLEREAENQEAAGTEEGDSESLSAKS